MTVVLAAVTVLAPQASAQPGLAWTKCPPSLLPLPDDPRMQCAKLRVPLDYRAPSGKTIEIAISRIATAKPGLRRGILLHNGGGPGVPSLHLTAAYTQIYPPEVLDRYDLIGFDPRGIGYSTPVTCGRAPEQIPMDLFIPFPAPDGSIDRNVEFAKAMARDCQARSGDVLPYITTANTARDMDRIRVALGESKLSYNSGSYGSYLGAVYATLFANRTDRVIIDSNIDPAKVWTGQWNMLDVANELRFPDLAKFLAERDSELHFGATPAEVRKSYFDLVARLDAKPVAHPEIGPITGNVLRALTRAYMYHTLQFPEVARFWVFADRGGVAPKNIKSLAQPNVPGDNQTAALLAVTCGDSPAPKDIRFYQRGVAVNRVKYPVMNGMGANIWPCAFWRDPVEPPVRVTNKGPSNILMVQTLRDPATPYVSALGMRQALGRRATMITVDSGNHGAYDPATPSCATRGVHSYLATGTRPGDQFCGPDPGPARPNPLATLLR
ncbi:pimeloyl-ACP methyl ester carboxylesterase [Kibdelosporangium banguiense]|uniref:Pimeloyl-ACP methyl ester carboxylesterase n=1 Tax=Kibdelosporangium banguiense TaxID=1365924 RepID=A0ABS4TQK4_9PSEU|nr:alpha/beta hydrolase [Kibdelosporangium banguiense]MBP2326225.1 pimeloyl-ACP methyl ester carboxylesterase [Kibdelosporangium banguiense]